MKKSAQPDIKELEQFALMMSWAWVLFFYILIPWIFEQQRHWWPFVISGLFLTLYFIAPSLIRYPYKLWMFISGIMGWINTRIILGFTFYVLIFPLGIVLKLLGKLQYKNRPIENKNSYYISSDREMKKEDLENPF